MIKSVKKVKTIVPKVNKEDVLIALQRAGLIMLSKVNDNSSINTKEDEEIIQRAESAIKKLGEYKKKQKKFFTHNAVLYNNFIENYDERLTMLNDLETRFDDLNFLKNEIKDEEAMIKEVYPFKALEYTSQELKKTRFISFHFGYVPENRKDFFDDYCKKDTIDFLSFSSNELGYPILLYLDIDLVEKKFNQLKRFGFVEVEVPIIDETFSEYIKLKERLIEEKKQKIVSIEKSFNEKIEREIKILVDQTIAKIERKQIAYTENENDVVFEGWISEDDAHELQGIVRKITLDYQLEFSEPTEYDNVPTLLKNNRFVTPFESITNTYSPPNYAEIDPNPIMSIWYFIIFGMMIGDFGYGALMVIVFGLFMKIKKPKGQMGQLANILFYNGFSAMFFGILFGSAFGIEFDVLNLINKDWKKLFNIVSEPLPVLIFSIAIGILHLMSGLVMKIIVSIKKKEYFESLSKGFSWLFILIGIALFALNIVLKVAILNAVSLIFIGLGVILILIFNGIKKKTVAGKVIGGLGGLYSITSYLSDILSYSRILALALSSSIIAYTMNTLAGLLQTNIIGFLMSFIVYIIGHVFNFAIGLLSAYVHGSRLQYLEFYGKFYVGEGYIFSPLKFNTKYINEIK